ncbi:hypothetical protein QYF36_012382 [Acer negundo]|nr:hypothetical protein QYF36_012382 [Acer negundo]
MGLAIVGRASPALPILHLWWQHLPNTPPNIRSYPFNLGLKGLQRSNNVYNIPGQISDPAHPVYSLNLIRRRLPPLRRSSCSSFHRLLRLRTRTTFLKLQGIYHDEVLVVKRYHIHKPLQQKPKDAE